MSLDKEHSNDQVQVRLSKLKALKKELGPAAFRNDLSPKDSAQALHEQFKDASKEALEEKLHDTSVCGRIMAIRLFGKAAFVRVKDYSGEIQLFFQKNKLGDERFQFFKSLDVGDLVFAKGPVFRTKTGELSVNVDSFEIVTKSLRPLPEKFHGISDVEIKYRQRYLDLMISDETRKTFEIRSKITRLIRKFFEEKRYLEVETPMMHPIAGGAAARPFKTFHNTLEMELYLRIAPELYLKRLLVGGLDRVFEINRNFRNEGISIQHNPEFTMLEFYQAYATYEDLMPLTEDLFRVLAKEIHGGETISYQGEEIHLASPWKRMRVEEAVLELSDFKDQTKLRDRDALIAYLKQKGYKHQKEDPVGKLLLTIFEEEVEHQLIQPTFITHYPLDVSPLSRKSDADPFLVDRFELFITGREIANGFSELNDPQDQYDRFVEQVKAKELGDDEACEMDEDYVRALEYGMPPAAGEGVGIDRMVMLFADRPSIRDVILFPQLRKQSKREDQEAPSDEN